MAVSIIVRAATAVAGLALLAACATNEPAQTSVYPRPQPTPIYQAPEPPPAPEPVQPDPDQASSGIPKVWSPDDGSYPMIVGRGDETVTIVLNGEIKEGDTERLVLSIKDAAERYPKATGGLFLNSPGGNALEAERMASLIHRTGLPVMVISGDTCASACFLLFAASEHKFASRSARIGVHSVSNEDGGESGGTLMLTAAMARDFKIMNVPPEITGRMITTPPDGMAWLTPDEEAEMGVSIVD